MPLELRPGNRRQARLRLFLVSSIFFDILNLEISAAKNFKNVKKTNFVEGNPDRIYTRDLWLELVFIAFLLFWAGNPLLASFAAPSNK